jgi:hypothetical protein
MLDISSILPAYLSAVTGQSPPERLALEPATVNGGNPILLLLAVGLLVIALRSLRRALAPFAVVIRSLAAAAVAALFVFVALCLTLLAVATRH